MSENCSLKQKEGSDLLKKLSEEETSPILYMTAFQKHTLMYLKKKAEETGAIDFHPFYILLIKKHQGMSQDELAKIVQKDKAAVARTVKNLEEKGYVLRKQDPKDKRKNGLYLTEKGLEAFGKIESIESDLDEVVLKGFTAKERKSLSQLLQRATINIVEETLRLAETNKERK